MASLGDDSPGACRRSGGGALLVALGLLASGCAASETATCRFDSDCPAVARQYCDRSTGSCEPRTSELDDGIAPPVSDAGMEDAAVMEVCDNGVDDDLDGAIDCADGECINDPACEEVPRWIAYVNASGLPSVSLVRTDTLATVPVDGDGATTIATAPWFHPNGTSLAYFYGDEDGSGIRILDLLTGEMELFTVEGVTQYGHPAISPDGSRMVTQVIRGTRADVAVFDLDSGQIIADLAAPDDLSFYSAPIWAGDADTLVAHVGSRTEGTVFGNGVAEIGRLDLDSGEVTPLTVDARPLGTSSWWPEENAVLVESQTAGQLVAIDPLAERPARTFELATVASRSDTSCRPIAGTLAACVRRNEIDQRSVTDIALVDLGDGALLRRLTSTPRVNEASPTPSSVDARDLSPITPLSP